MKNTGYLGSIRERKECVITTDTCRGFGFLRRSTLNLLRHSALTFQEMKRVRQHSYCC